MTWEQHPEGGHRHEYVLRTWTEIHHGVGVGVGLVGQEVTK